MTNRAAVKRRIVLDICPVALAAVDLGVANRTAEQVPAAYGLPPDTATSTCLYFGGNDSKVDGDVEVAGMRRNSPREDDTFTLNGTIDAFGFDSDLEAEEGAERILNALRAVLKRCQSLNDRTNGAPTPDGVADGSDPSAYRVAWARVGNWGSQLFSPVGDTHVCRITFQIECSSYDV